MLTQPPVPSGFYPCPLCTVQVQRVLQGTLQDGLTAHYKTCHPSVPVPVIALRRANGRGVS